MSDIESAFHQEMLNMYRESANIGYRPTYFLQMVQEHGGVEAAHRLLASENVAEGFTKLWELGRTDLTVEAQVLKPEYATLFSEEEREKARQRLGHQAPDSNNTPDSASTPAPAANPPSMVERLAHAVANTQGNGADSDTTTWIFQANPQYYDLAGSLAVLPEQTWQVNQYKQQIKAGHTVYFWEAGAQAGILARGRILTDPAKMPQDAAEQAFVRSDDRFDGNHLRVRVHIDEVLPNCITRQELAADPVLQELPILKFAQGTNFPVQPDQAAVLAALFDRVMANTQGSGTTTDGVTGAEAGLSGEDQIRIALQEIEQHDGSATIQQIYNAVNRHIGRPLSEQGRASLRYFVNTVAVERGYVYPYDTENPGWRITPEGRAWLARAVANTQGGGAGMSLPDATLDTATDYYPALLWLMGELGEAKTADVMSQFEQQFGHLILSEHREANNSGDIRWKHYVRWGRQKLKDIHLMESGGYGIWRITETGRQFLYEHPDLADAKVAILSQLADEAVPPEDEDEAALDDDDTDDPVLEDDDTDDPVLDDDEDELPRPDLDAPTFVVIHKGNRNVQVYGKTYTFSSKAGGSWKQLRDDLYRTDFGGQPVQFIIYRSGPHYAFTAWARVIAVQQWLTEKGEDAWTLDLEQYEFPHPVSARDLTDQLDWLAKGLAVAFRGVSIRRISPEDIQTILNAADAYGDPVALESWQQHFVSENPLVQRLFYEHPAWLQDIFGDEIRLDPKRRGRLSVYLGERRRQEYDFNYKGGLYVEHGDLTPDEIELLRHGLSDPSSLKELTRKYAGSTVYWRFHVRTEGDYALLQDLTRAMIEGDTVPMTNEATGLPTTLGLHLKSYVKLVTHLHDPAYTPDQIVERLGRISPPIAPGLTEKPDAEQLVNELLLLRLLEPLDDGRYRRWSHLTDNTEPHLLRYAALTLLVPAADGSLYLPILSAPLDGQPHPAADWPLGEALPQWYEEAGLVERTPDGLWRSLPDALEPLEGDDPATRMYNRFLDALLAEVAGKPADLLPVPLEQPLPAIRNLEERLRELDADLLINAQVVKRICRSLLAGRHVVLVRRGRARPSWRNGCPACSGANPPSPSLA